MNDVSATALCNEEAFDGHVERSIDDNIRDEIVVLDEIKKDVSTKTNPQEFY